MRPTGQRIRRCACNAAELAGRRSALRVARLLLVSAISLSAPLAHAQENPAASQDEAGAVCRTPSGWVDVATGTAYQRRILYRDLAAERSVVLLGESHDKADHHRWQLHTLAALNGRVEKMVIGFEAFPRRVQPVLDRWIAGEYAADAFLKAVEWRKVWGFDPDLYMPLFEFARIQGIPMVALNVERELVSRVGDEGWAAVPEGEREGVSDPAPASPAYERQLVDAYLMTGPVKGDPAEVGAMPHGEAGDMPHGEAGDMPHGHTGETHDEAGEVPGELESHHGEKALADLMGDAKFRRFVEAQLTWDRAMAEVLAKAKRDHPGAMVAGIIGSGHVENGYGVPHQLRDLGVADVAILLPVEVGEDCQDVVGSTYADAVFTLPPAMATPPPDYPKLGVYIADGERGVRIERVVADSVAEGIGLRAADEIISAAGLKTQKMDELIGIVHRQAPGTWLPLTVMREGTEIEFVAKFPPRPLAER